MVKVCPNCRAENEDRATHCTACGASLASAPTDDSASTQMEETAPGLSGSPTTANERGPWHDVAKLLAFIWAVFSSLFIGASLSVLSYADPAAGGLLCTTYLAVATLAPWAIVFLVWRWPTIGAFALLAAFVIWLVFAGQSGGLDYWACVLLGPGLLALPPAAALALHLAERRGGQLA